MDKTRTYKSIKNSLVATLSQLISVILSFVTRTFFIKFLSIEYLGVNGLFSNILTMLSLAEMGIGTAIIYSMYKPLSERDEYKISALMNLYSKAYKYIGIFVGVIGLALVPFLSILIKDTPDINNLELIYILYLINSTTSYFFTYKRSIIIADQYGYINKFNLITFSLIQNISQMAILMLTHNFYLYLITQIICTVLSNVFISIKANKMYPFLKKYKDAKIDTETRHRIFKNVIAMISHKLGSVVVSGTDNLLISALVGIKSVGIYSNYILITNTLKGIIIQGTEAITATVGNLTTIESEKYSYNVYKKIYFINFFVTFFVTAFLFSLINPFIVLWIGKEYLLDIKIVVMIIINFYLVQMRQPAIIYINTYGLFWQIRWKSIIEAVINLIISVSLGYLFKLGIIGILIGTFFSNVLTNMWWEPFVTFKYGFKMGVKKYFLMFLWDTAIWLMNIFLIYKTCLMFNFSGIKQLIINFIITACVSIFTFSIFFAKRKEFRYCFKLVKMILEKFVLWIKRYKIIKSTGELN